MVINRLRIAMLLGLWSAVIAVTPSLSAQTVAPHDLKYIPGQPVVAIWSRPMQHFANPAIAKVLDDLQQLDESVPEKADAFLHIDQMRATFAMPDKENPGLPTTTVVYHFTDPKHADYIVQNQSKLSKLEPLPENTYPFPVLADVNRLPVPLTFLAKLDARSVAMTSGKDSLKQLIASSTDKPAWSKELQALNPAGTVVLLDLAQIRELGNKQLANVKPQGMEALLFGNVKSLWDNADYAFISLDTANGIQLSAVAQSANAESAQRFKGTIEGLLGIAKGLLPMAKQGTEQLNKMTPGMGTMLYAELETTLNGIKITQTGTQTKLTLGISQEFLAKVPALLLPQIKAARAAAMANASRNNLKQIALGLLNYMDATKSFPAAVMLGPDGKTPHSWRVAILPYIEEQALYNQYKFDEPWDSENNKKVAATIPQVYRSPLATNGANCTSYVVLTHADGVFNSTPAARGNGTRARHIVDGMSRTIAVVEANAEIPWTKPEDLPVVDGQPLPKLGIPGATTINAAFCDGSVHSLSTALKEELLRNLISMKDGKVIDMEELYGPAIAPHEEVPGAAPAKAMPAPPPAVAPPAVPAPAPPRPPLPAPAPPAFSAPPKS